MKRILFALALLLAPAAYGQLLQSGGSGGATSITQWGGTAVVTGGVNGSVGVGGLAAAGASAAGNPVWVAGEFNTTPATLSSGQVGSLQLDSSENLLVNLKTALPAGTNLIGYARPQNSCGTTNYESVLSMLPSSSTSVTSTTTCVSEIVLNNTSSSSATVTVQDQSTACNSAACQVLSAYSIPGNSLALVQLYGTKFASGIKWNASAATTIVGNIIGNQ